ncbi:MAG TPA: NAD-binding protein [Dehalococcoidia bacterium]|jgi:trk system potassium uptake protein TrkA|nr:NAD-binding protein [Dehalococcoidia bacterium]
MGCGRLGAELAMILETDGHEVSILDVDKYAFDHLPTDFKGQKVLGDGTDQDTLRRAGAERADAFVAATRGDNRNALAVQIAKHVFQIKRVGGVIFDPIREEVYRSLGIRTINPTKLEAGLLRESIEREED